MEPVLVPVVMEFVPVAMEQLPVAMEFVPVVRGQLPVAMEFVSGTME